MRVLPVVPATQRADDDHSVPRRPRDQSTGCFHHVMGRGCRGQPILGTDDDRQHFSHLLSQVVEQHGWSVYSWVLMPNHHHLLLRLSQPNLAHGMHRLHFMFGQRWNTRQSSKGHVLFRRYTNIPLRRENAGLFVMRYIDLNPVRAGLCARPEDWPWSGYAATVGRRRPLAFHAAEEALRIGAPGVIEPEAARLEYARGVHARLEATLGRGTPSDTRPTLAEIITPGNPDSIRHSLETWGYGQRDVARHFGCSQAAVSIALRRGVEPPPRAA